MTGFTTMTPESVRYINSNEIEAVYLKEASLLIETDHGAEYSVDYQDKEEAERVYFRLLGFEEGEY